jgi:16S rRNA (guanine1207-N2)-methyltransferase
VRLPGGERSWVVYPGLFAHGQLDAATALLIESVPSLPAGCRVLDFGCGTGIIGAALLQRGDRVDLDQLDADAVAVEAACENLPNARTWLASSVAEAPAGVTWDRVLSNPPIHESVVRSYSVLEELALNIGGRLRPDGEVWLVAQRQVPVAQIFLRSGYHSRTVAERNAFRVWRIRVEGVRPKGPL